MLRELLDIRVLILVALVFIPLERLLTLRKGQGIFRREWSTDLAYLLLNRVPIQLGLLVLLGTVGLGLRAAVPDGLRAAVAAQPLWLQCAGALVVADIGFYLAHRAFHAIPWLWRFHAVHHSIEELDWLAAARVHPIDQIVTKGVSLIPLYALGFSAAAIGVHATIYLWHSVLLHANVRLPFGPLRWLVASPEFHHWHHANEPEAYNANYAGQLAFLDLLFGTVHLPRGRRPGRFGVDDPVPRSFLRALAYPFQRRAARP